jgi:hypothetical protein
MKTPGGFPPGVFLFPSPDSRATLTSCQGKYVMPRRNIPKK